MIESYLFVNPIDHTSILEVMDIVKLQQMQSQTIKSHIVPVISMPFMDNYLIQRHITRSQLSERNYFVNLAYDLTVHFEKLATLNVDVSLQFLEEASKRFDTHTYTKEWANDRILFYGKKHNQNPSCHFKRCDSIISNKIHHNHQLAHEMGVTTLPSMVIYNFNSYDDFAVRLDDLKDHHIIAKLIQADSMDQALNPFSKSITK